MTCRTLLPKIGDSIRVRTASPYDLPTGLQDGQMVEVVADDTCGAVVIDESGCRYRVPLQCCETREEYLLDGRWVPESHPAVLEHLIALIVELESTRNRWPKGIERANQSTIERSRKILREHMR